MNKTIGIGSKNKAKMKAVQKVFHENDYVLNSYSVDSGVSAQPFSDEETKKGAVLRAKVVIDEYGEKTGIGLEGGVQPMEDGLYLCNWGALVTIDGFVATAAGAKIKLPENIAADLYDGKELKSAMKDFTEQEGISQAEGAIGIFTAGKIDRTKMFSHIVEMLYGQWCYRYPHK
ncbi:DUF84 family protein [Alteribacillus iranensis]|uniref:inosine/xanthosine triphosphatase n=1 Tax=Alteribacillus iranensis TaxID=930128 RepID=A0A1I2ER36_9BACI|nr:DUF84 family protein [Alteribacillus iranensis]SFE95584.1 inosine/xanthosine triphosphatase [Alteribacillus iranensis]